MTTEFTSADAAARRDGSALSEGLGLVPERAAFDAWFAAATFETMGSDWQWAAWQASATAERKRTKDIVTKAALTQAPLDAEEWTSPEAAFQAAVKSMALDIILRIDGYVPSDERRNVQGGLDFGA